MGNANYRKVFQAIVEIDETHVGGKPRERNRKDDDDKPNKRGRRTNKNPVVGIVDREKKKVYAKVSVSNKGGKKLSGHRLLVIGNEICKSNATVITDGFRGYGILRKTEYIHLVVDHTKESVNDFVRANNVESFWVILKRGIYGIYHHVSVKYLQNYVHEFCFTFDNRDTGDMFDLVLKQAVMQNSN